jgi:hypothetical protein
MKNTGKMDKMSHRCLDIDRKHRHSDLFFNTKLSFKTNLVMRT